MNKRINGVPVDILLVQNSPEEVRIISKALQQGKVRNRLHTVGDGFEAMAYLHRDHPYHDAPTPDLVLLDTGPASKNGVDVINQLAADPVLAQIPVVVLVDSMDDAASVRDLAGGATSSIVKPFDFGKFIDVVQVIERFSLLIICTPPSD